MKIYSISVLLAPPASKPTLLSNANYLSRQEAISDEFMTSLCEAVAETTSQGQRQSIHKDDCTAHIYNHGGPEQLAAVIITDKEYPVWPAFSLLANVLEDFVLKVPQSAYADPSTIAFPDIHVYIQKYQDPRQADAVMKLDTKPNALTTQSKMFYKAAEEACMTVSLIGPKLTILVDFP